MYIAEIIICNEYCEYTYCHEQSMKLLQSLPKMVELLELVENSVWTAHFFKSFLAMIAMINTTMVEHLIEHILKSIACS